LKPIDVEENEFFKFAGFKKGDVIWDFGCGDCRFYFPLHNMGCDVYYTDRKISNPEPKEKVDKFLLSCVLHYNKLSDKMFILLTAYCRLKKGGQIIIIEPNKFNPFFYCLYFWRWLRRSKCERRWSAEKYMFSEKELIKILKMTGFKNIECRKYAWLPSKFGLLFLNSVLNRIPIINMFNAFNWVKGEK
jgi:hypothetical protein